MVVLKVQDHYAKFVTSGGDGSGVLERRAADLGYQHEFLRSIILNNDNNSNFDEDNHNEAIDDWYNTTSDKLFQASCGSGCPLRLPGGQPTADDCLVMDFGCGAGHDVLLASHMIMKEDKSSSSNYSHNNKKKVIGIDVTLEMVEAAKKNAEDYYYDHHASGTLAGVCEIEFIQEDLENPSAEFLSRFGVEQQQQQQHKVDLILSNGVLNLCQDKLKAFQVAFQLLRPGGRMVFSDVMKLDKENDKEEVFSQNGVHVATTASNSIDEKMDVFSS